MTDDAIAAYARAIIDANLYLTLGTVDADGHPWTSPVYFSAAGERDFLWVSETDARHSRHVAAHPRVSVVVFDSTVPPYHGRAVYGVGEAREVAGDDLDRAIGSYPRPDTGASSITREDVTAAGAVPPLPGAAVGDVGAVPAGAPAALCAARARQGPPDARTAGLICFSPTTSFVLTIEVVGGMVVA